MYYTGFTIVEPNGERYGIPLKTTGLLERTKITIHK